ncbi:MAG: MgtC/SapB family protein [Polyangiaceae bacterium]|nr:MgtC/SapB family protein [Polyangiaceae bacterium]
MDAYEPFLSLAVACAVGLLIGLEREQSHPASSDDRRFFFGGSRTFPLFALAGAISALLARSLGPSIVLVPFLAIMALLLTVHVSSLRAGADVGLTSEVAALVTFLLGALATSRGVIEPTGQRLVVVSAVAVVMTLVLSLKPVLHSLVQQATKDDVYATLKFLLVAVVVLPLMPDRTLGPFDVLNPYKIGWMIVLIAGVSFVGYVAIRVLGPGRGLGLTGLVGGLVSSTVVTLAASGSARRDPSIVKPAALAVVLASSVMYVRVLILVAVIERSLVRPLLPPLLAMTAAGALVAAVLLRPSREGGPTHANVSFANPFELSQAVKFAALFTAVLMGVKFASQNLGSSGIYVTSAIAGAPDVDAIALSMANLVKTGLDVHVAANAIWIAVASNTVAKGLMAIILGGWAFGRVVAAGFGAMLAASLVGLVVP